MKQKGDKIASFLLILFVVSNVIGVAIPVWYHKEHQHTVNKTQTKPDCVVHVYIREGLWQRYCVESRVEDCILDVSEWCDNLDFPIYNPYVIGLEIFGDLFLLFAIGTIVRSKCRREFFNMEMVAAESGLGGLLMAVGILVYAVTDTGEIGYKATDLHIGWALCSFAGLAAICLCVYGMHVHINTRYAVLPEYFLIDDDDDDALIMLDNIDS